MKKLKQLVLFIGLLIVIPAVTTFILGGILRENDFDLLSCISSFSFLLFYVFGRLLIKKFFSDLPRRDYYVLNTAGYILTVLLLYLLVWFL